MRGKKYLLVPIIAIIALAMVSLPVKASPYINFFVNYRDPLTGVGSDIIPGVDPKVGEFIYKDTNLPGNYKVGATDVRLTPVKYMGMSYAAGSTVAAGDADVGLTTKTAWGAVKHRDTGATASYYDFGEYIYRDVDASGTVTAGDVRYSPVPGYLLGSTVAAGDTDVGGALVTFKSGSPNYERWAEYVVDSPPLIANGVYDFAHVFVDVMIDTDIPDSSFTGVVGVGFAVKVDPSVLTPYGGLGGATGYFLADFIARAGLSGYSTSLLVTPMADYIDDSEMIMPTPPIGAGNQSTYPGEFLAEKLVTLLFTPQSQTAWSPIDLVYDPKGNYMTPDGLWHTVTMIDGNYCPPPPVPEFPLGIAPIIMLAPLIPIVYLWRKRPKRRV